ncbi:hypothetical protein ACFLRA_01060 [Bdellovibrionota bacterium]
MKAFRLILPLFLFFVFLFPALAFGEPECSVTGIKTIAPTIGSYPGLPEGSFVTPRCSGSCPDGQACTEHPVFVPGLVSRYRQDAYDAVWALIEEEKIVTGTDDNPKTLFYFTCTCDDCEENDDGSEDDPKDDPEGGNTEPEDGDGEPEDGEADDDEAKPTKGTIDWGGALQNFLGNPR